MAAKTLRTAIGVLLLVAMVAAPYAYAICRSYSEVSEYYNGCGVTPTWVGSDGYDCGTYTWQNGTTGHWMVVTRAYCTQGPQGLNHCYEEEPSSYLYYEKCGTSWVSRTQAQFNAGSCQCS